MKDAEGMAEGATRCARDICRGKNGISRMFNSAEWHIFITGLYALRNRLSILLNILVPFWGRMPLCSVTMEGISKMTCAWCWVLLTCRILKNCNGKVRLWLAGKVQPRKETGMSCHLLFSGVRTILIRGEYHLN